MSNDLVKQDLNFMETPLWFQDEVLAEKSSDGYTWHDKDGYLYRAGYKPPVKTDFIFLLYLLLQSQKNDWNTEISMTRYQILTACGYTNAPYWYERFEDSLRRWKMLALEFKGCFYDGATYAHMSFGIIDSWTLNEETKELKVFFSPFYIKKIQESTFFRYLNFTEFKAIKSPLATRLYEIVVKMFQTRSFWEIDCIKMAEKIPMNEKYPAHIIPKIKTAVNRINENTSLNLKLSTRRKKPGEVILCFEKLASKPMTPTMAGLPETKEFKALVDMLPIQHKNKKTILEMIAKALNRHAFQYTARNISYTIKQARKNFRAYLDKALKDDLGKGWAEDIEIEKQRNAAFLAQQKLQEEKHRQELKEVEKDRELLNKAMLYYNSLSLDKQAEISRLAIESLDDNIKDVVVNKKITWEIHFKYAIRNVLLKQAVVIQR